MRLVDINLGRTDASDNEVTLGEYLTLLLKGVLGEQEGFDGKRPFGNSGWFGEIAVPLVKHKIVHGKVYYDRDTGEVDSADYDEHEVLDVLQTALKEMYTKPA